MFDSFRLLSSEQKHAVTNWTPTRGIYATINMYDIFSLLSVVNSIRLHSNLFLCVFGCKLEKISQEYLWLCTRTRKKRFMKNGFLFYLFMSSAASGSGFYFPF